MEATGTGIGEYSMKTVIDIHSQSFKRYFANTSWLMGHRVLSMIVALFVGVYVARYSGPERRDELLGTAFWLKAGGAILMWIGIAR